MRIRQAGLFITGVKIKLILHRVLNLARELLPVAGGEGFFQFNDGPH